MTNTQKQCLLACLGYYPADSIDGKWGAMSEDATIRFQDDYDLEKDGIFGKATTARILEVIASGEQPKESGEEPVSDFWSGVRYFDRGEFGCKCGGKYCNGFPVEPDEKLVELLEKIRGHFGKAVYVTSGIRCETHNANVGGVSSSQHKKGTAADIVVKDIDPAEVYAYADKLLNGTGGVGRYDTFTHVDVRKSKSRWKG